MNHYIHNDVVITEKELLSEIVNLREKISDLESDRRNQRKIVNQYKSIFPKITNPMFLTDVSGKIIDANSEFIHFLGYSLFDLRRMSIKSIIPMELHENETKILLEELQRNIRINSRCSVYFKINGEKVEVDLEVIATFDDYNNFDGITRIIKNIL
ncbi:MAG: PAS domain-containing protein [Ignavibacteriales bacterium]|nr:PAS domain-containing protein [Ignavibacteriales bacterium]